jgi:hypothetical protein
VVEDLSGPDGTAVAAMQQIADWLKKLGMSEYADRLVENRIGSAFFPDLPDRTLKTSVSCSATVAVCRPGL